MTYRGWQAFIDDSNTSLMFDKYFTLLYYYTFYICVTHYK